MPKCLNGEMIIIDPEAFWGLAGSCGGDKKLSVEITNTCSNVTSYFPFVKLEEMPKPSLS